MRQFTGPGLFEPPPFVAVAVKVKKPSAAERTVSLFGESWSAPQVDRNAPEFAGPKLWRRPFFDGVVHLTLPRQTTPLCCADTHVDPKGSVVGGVCADCRNEAARLMGEIIR